MREHNAMSPARARAQTARSGVELPNHEATAPPTAGASHGENWPLIKIVLFLCSAKRPAIIFEKRTAVIGKWTKKALINSRRQKFPQTEQIKIL